MIYQVTRTYYCEEGHIISTEYFGTDVRKAWITFRGICKDSQIKTKADKVTTSKGALSFISNKIEELNHLEDDELQDELVLNEKCYEIHQVGTGRI